MSFTGYRWGTTRSFIGERSTFRVIAHLHDSVIDKLMLIHVNGDTHEAVETVKQLETEYVGKTEREWNEPVPLLPNIHANGPAIAAALNKTAANMQAARRALTHKLVNNTLLREADGIVAYCECGWNSGPHFSSMLASVSMLDHREAMKLECPCKRSGLGCINYAAYHDGGPHYYVCRHTGLDAYVPNNGSAYEHD